MAHFAEPQNDLTQDFLMMVDDTNEKLILLFFFASYNGKHPEEFRTIDHWKQMKVEHIEFKETHDKSLQREMVAFANASGGVIYLGIADFVIVKGIEATLQIYHKLKNPLHPFQRRRSC